jgi:hypothetical protein
MLAALCCPTVPRHGSAIHPSLDTASRPAGLALTLAHQRNDETALTALLTRPFKGALRIRGSIDQ